MPPMVHAEREGAGPVRDFAPVAEREGEAPSSALDPPSPASDASAPGDGEPSPGSGDGAAEPALPLASNLVRPGVRGEDAQSVGFRRPSPESARAVLRMLGTDGRERSIEVDGRPLTVGRARDNGLVIDDARVSRHHGRLLARHGALVYADLDSTNGSRVNGVRVDEIALGVGDRILLGDTVLVVETLPG